MEAREMHLYSPKVEEDEIKNFFDLVVKARFPFLGFIDFSGILSLNAINLIWKRKENTIQMFVKEKPDLKNLSALIFPFRMCGVSDLDKKKGSFLPFPKLYLINGSNHDILDFFLKADVEEVSIRISKVLGKFIGIGSITDSKGKKGLVVVLRPQNFFRIDLEKNPSIYMELLEPLPKKMHMNSDSPVFEDADMSIGVDNYDSLQHSLIVGTSGAGKSKALYVLLRAIEAKHKNNARTIIIDPHGEFSRMMPECKSINFIKNYIEPLDVGKSKSPMLTQLIAQLMSQSIGQENKYSERVLFYAVYLLSSIDKLELSNIASLLTDSAIKAEYVSTCDNPEVKRFFDEEYNDIYIHHFDSAILPILNFIGEYQLYLGKKMKRENLLESISKNNITVVSFDPHFFGRRMISFLAGAIINQMYILAITGKLMDKPTILVVDEFPRVETRVTRDILSETRKFNLFAYLSCQYLGQLSKEVVDAMVSNVRNIISFKVNKQDAAMLSSIMEIKVEEYFKKNRATTELEESKKEMFVRLHQRECIVRLFDGKKYLLPMKLKVADAAKWGLREGSYCPPASEDDGADLPDVEEHVEEPKPDFPNPIHEKNLMDKMKPKTGNRKPNTDVGFGAFAISVDQDEALIKREKRKLRKDELGL
jgi:hypothetical protein